MNLQAIGNKIKALLNPFDSTIVKEEPVITGAVLAAAVDLAAEIGLNLTTTEQGLITTGTLAAIGWLVRRQTVAKTAAARRIKRAAKADPTPALDPIQDGEVDDGIYPASSAMVDPADADDAIPAGG